MLLRDHTDRDVAGHVSLYETDEFILNLGRSWSDYDGLSLPTVNRGTDIFRLLTPQRTRELLDELSPPQDIGEVWIKGPGRGGKQKFKCWTDYKLVMPDGWDWQLHLEGQEYRIITVGNRIVQDLQRFGDNENREYHWIAMAEVPWHVKETVRLATNRLEGLNVIAWDVIDEGSDCYIFEGNTCPGMSEPTAKRIVTEIRRQLDE